MRASINQAAGSYTEIKAFAMNHSAWPARVMTDLSYNYYFDLSEVFEAGLTADDVTVKIGYDEWSQAETVGPLQYKDNIYYVKIKYKDGSVLAPIGKEQEQAEIQVRISVPDQNKIWDSSNDYSIEGLTNDNQNQNITERITMYDGDTLIWGTEPDGTKATGVVEFKPVIRDNENSESSEPETSESFEEDTEIVTEAEKEPDEEIQNTEKPDDSSETDQTESKQSIIILSVLIVIALIGFGFIVAKKSKK